VVRGLRLGATFVQLLLERGQLLIPRAVQSGLLLPRAALLGVTAVQARQKRKRKAAAGCVARAGQGTNLVPHALPSGRRSWSESLACCFDFAVRLSEQAKIRISQHIPRQKHDALTLQSAGPRRGTRRAGRARGSLARRAAYHRCQEEWRARAGLPVPLFLIRGLEQFSNPENIEGAEGGDDRRGVALPARARRMSLHP